MSQTREDGTDEGTGVAPPEGEGSEQVDGGVGLVEDPHAACDAKVQDLEGRLRAVSSAYKQKVEEIGNVKDRLARQAAVQEEIRRGEVVMSLFEPVENLNRSMEAAKGTVAEEGLRMVYQQFLDALRRLGLEEVPGVGSPFDPNLHEAIATEPVTDKAQDNVVTSVFSTGYRIGNRLIRPARVVNGSYTEPQAEA